MLTAARQVGAEIVAHGASNSDSLSGRSPAQERDYLSCVADRSPRAEGSGPGRLVQSLARATPRPPWTLLARDGLPLSARPAAGRPAGLAADRDRARCWPSRTAPSSTTRSTMVGRLRLGRRLRRHDRRRVRRAARAAAADQPLVMSIVLHSFICGVPFRLRPLARALAHLAGADGVWFTQPRHIHRAVQADPVDLRADGGTAMSRPGRRRSVTCACRWSGTASAARSCTGSNLDIAPGEILGLVGESGSGKSVLALSLLGLLPASSRPNVSGPGRRGGRRHAVAGPRPTAAGPAGQPGRDLPGSDDLAEPDDADRSADRRGHRRRRRVGPAAEAVGVRDAALRLQVYPHQLSGGLRQRVMAAIAVAGQPAADRRRRADHRARRHRPGAAAGPAARAAGDVRLQRADDHPRPRASPTRSPTGWPCSTAAIWSSWARRRTVVRRPATRLHPESCWPPGCR